MAPQMGAGVKLLIGPLPPSIRTLVSHEAYNTMIFNDIIRRPLKYSDRVRIFQRKNKTLIIIIIFIALNLAKDGVEGSNPFARSMFS